MRDFCKLGNIFVRKYYLRKILRYFIKLKLALYNFFHSQSFHLTKDRFYYTHFKVTSSIRQTFIKRFQMLSIVFVYMHKESV